MIPANVDIGLVTLGVILILVVTLILPIEVILILGMLGTVLADTPSVGGAVYYARFFPMGMLAMRALADWLGHRERESKIVFSFFIPSLMFLVIAFASIIYSIDDQVKTFLRVLSMVFVVIGFGIGLPNFVGDDFRFRRTMRWIIVFLAIVVVIGSVGPLADSGGAAVTDTYTRSGGIFGNPNTYGLMGMITFYPLVWWWLDEKSNRNRFALGITIILVFAAIGLSGSRASFVGILMGFIIISFLQGRLLSKQLLVSMILLLLVFLAGSIDPSFARLFDFANDSDRSKLWQRAWELGWQSPLGGFGFGASDLVFRIDGSYLLSQGIATGGSHSSYFRMWVDLGILGIAFGFNVFVVILGRVFLRRRQVSHDPLVLYLTATVVTGLINGIFEDWLYGFGSASTLPFWFFLAMLAVRLDMLQSQQPTSAMPSPLIPVSHIAETQVIN
jgi:O-antigen ligase